jgi:hypothetical protein
MSTYYNVMTILPTLRTLDFAHVLGSEQMRAMCPIWLQLKHIMLRPFLVREQVSKS